MIRTVPSPTLALGLALMLLAGPAVANDSAGFEGTGGIELTASPDVRMVSEDLRIGLDEIRVAYVFRNMSDHPVDTLVAFPLPDIDAKLGSTAANWAFPIRADDFLGFKLWIDDRAVAPSLERRAFFKGQEVTRELEAAGALGMAPWRAGVHGYDGEVAKLAPAHLAKLRQEGLLADGEEADTPQWLLRTRYYWHQTFPPHVEVAVRHAYKPFVGGALLGNPDKVDGRGTVRGRLQSATTAGPDRYCLDRDTRRALDAVEARQPHEAYPFAAAELEYILTTARNWRGPIGRFHLTIDKGAADNIVSLCWTGLKKTGPTIFEAIVDNFVPSHDIQLLVFIRGKPHP